MSDDVIKEIDESVIITGVSFMKAMGNAYGADTAMAIWEKLCEAISPEVKGAIFMAMLTGDIEPSIVCVSVHPSMKDRLNKVAIIKAIRNYDVRGLGLKEAKDLMDHMVNTGTSLMLTLRKPSETLARPYHDAKVSLESAGCVVRSY